MPTPSNPSFENSTPRICRRIIALAVVGILAMPHAHSQVAPAASSTASAGVAGDETIELSPFITTAGSEKGYVATS